MVDAILIRHSAIRSAPIHEADIEVLRRRWPRIEEIRIEPEKRERFDQFDETYPWFNAQEKQIAQYQEVLDARDRFPNAQLLYMGFVAIPLAVHMGWLLGQTARVEIFQHHPTALSWAWPKDIPSRKLLRTTPGPPADATSSRDVLIRVSCSNQISPAKSQFLAERCHIYDVAVANPSRGALQSRTDLDRLAQAFGQALEDSVSAFPGARTRHLMAAVPVGAALALGMQLSATRHLPLQTWKYLGHRERPYVQALRIGEFEERPRVLLLGASPMNCPGISAPAEIQELRDLLEQHPGRLSVVDRPAAGARDLTELLSDVNPTVVHLASHGRDEDGFLPAALTLTTDAGFSHNVVLEDLVRLLKQVPKLQCVVIAACESNEIAEHLAEVVPAAIGFHGRLQDTDARSFSSAFWGSLVRGKSVAEAFHDGCMHLDESRRHQAQLFPTDDPHHQQLIPFRR